MKAIGVFGAFLASALLVASCGNFSIYKEPAVEEETYGLQAVIFDMDGTTQDYGCKTLITSLLEAFKKEGIPLALSEALEVAEVEPNRQVRQILARTKSNSSRANHETLTEQEIEHLSSKIRAVRLQCLREHGDLIPGTLETVNWIRQKEWKVAATTPFQTEELSIIAEAALSQGFSPDIAIASDMVPQDNPRSYMILKACGLLGAASVRAVVVDDTIAGIRAGREAGCWTIFVYKTGASLGLSQQEIANLSPEKREVLFKQAIEKAKPYANYIIPSIEEITPYLMKIDTFIKQGDYPFQFSESNPAPLPN